MDQNIKTHVSDLISYEKDIKPYKFIEIISGVGSGKSYFVEQLALRFKVLVISSRRAGIDYTVNNHNEDIYAERYSAKNWSELPPWERLDGISDLQSGLWVATNAQIEQYYYYKYKEGNDKVKRQKTIGSFFDIVVLEECHSIFCDSTYQNVGYYVGLLVEEIRQAKRKICKHIICTTATPEPCKSYFIKNYKRKEFSCIDLRDKCINIQPDNISFIDTKEIKQLIKSLYDADKKVVYFINSTQEEWHPKSFVDGTNINKNHIGFVCSNQSSLDRLKLEDIESYKISESVSHSINNSGKIPNDIKILLTTSKYKEGFPIINTDIDSVIIDNHRQSDVINMVGRFHNGIKNLYIVADSEPYKINMANENHYKSYSQLSLKFFNDYLQSMYDQLIKSQYCNTENRKTNILSFNNYLQLLQSTSNNLNPYIIYNYKLKLFNYNYMREYIIDYYYQQDIIWENANGNYVDILSRWFPNSNIVDYIPLKERVKYQFDTYFNENVQLNIGYNKEEFDRIVDDLIKIFLLDNNRRPQITTINKKMLKIESSVMVKVIKRNSLNYYYFYNRYVGLQPKDYKQRKKYIK